VQGPPWRRDGGGARQYRANLLIDKPLTLRGVDRPTISGGNQGDTIRVTAPDVVIEGLIVRDSGDSLKDQNAGIYIYPGAHRAVVRRCDLTYNLFGLWIEKADDVLIDNTITGKRDYDSSQRGNGIQLYNTTGARILGNNISFVRDALYVDVSHHAIFRGNKLHHSRYGTHYMNSYHNLWEDNDTYYNRGGLALMEVRDQVVRNNRAWGNSDHGIMLRTCRTRWSRTTWWPATPRLLHLRRGIQHPARQPGGGQPGGRAPVGRLHAQRGRGQRLHRQPRAGALRGRARRGWGAGATTGATTWAGTATATAWATCPTRPTTWSTA
jgi:hypothetical protein